MSSAINNPLIIIGTGLAGYNLAKEFRKLDSTTPLVLITQDDGHFYSKPQLSTALSYAKTPKQLIITDALTMQTQLQAQILTYSTVSAIDVSLQKITIENEQGQTELVYKDLVFAVGASPKPFPLLDGTKHHYRINSLQDYDRFIQHIDAYDKLTIIGSGLVGCEFAHDLSKKVKQINVITPDPHPLYNLVPAPVGESLKEALEKCGIIWHLKSQPAQVPSPTNAIVTAIGLHPNIALAKIAGLHTNQGIIVDSLHQTSQSHVYALGDCAEIDGICRQYVAPILQSARALAQTLCGKPTVVAFPLMPISLKVSTYPIIVYPPKAQDGEWQFDKHSDGVKAMYYDNDGILQGYALGGSQIEHRQECQKTLMAVVA